MSLEQRLADRALAPTLEDWRPRLFRLGNPEDRGTLERLLDGGAVFTVCDTLADQLADWLKASQPAQKWSPTDLAASAAAARGGATAAEYGAWVFYPWSGVLAHVLPADQFRFLRSVRNRYKITPADQEALRDKTIAVAGLSVGLSVTLTMALEGVGGRFRLADFDSLGLSNLNRLPGGVPDLGTNKAVLAARHLAELDPYLDVELFPAGVTDETLAAFLAPPLDLLVEECDDLAMKVRLREEARKRRVPVLMDTSDRGMLDVERFDREPERSLLHGLIGDVRAADLEGLTTKEKIPFALRILDDTRLTVELRASLAEVGHSIESWPQLGSAVMLGGAVAADAARRLLIGQFTDSGRFYVDVAGIVRDGAAAPLRPLPPPTVPQFRRPELPAQPGGCANGPPSEDEVRFLVGYAILAPSGGNCQPWRFEWRAGALHGYVLPERTQRFLDFGDRAAYLALGAAAENVVLAAGALGLTAEIEPCPDSAEPLVAFRATFRRTGDTGEPDLFALLPLRVTNRKTGPRVPLTPAERAALVAGAASRGGALRLIEGSSDLEATAAVMGRCDRYLLLTPDGHRDTMGELRFDGDTVMQTRDGLDVDSLEVSPAERAVLAVLADWEVMACVRRVGGGGGLELMARRAVAGSVALGMLFQPGTADSSFVCGGRAVQRMWLTATRLGLAIHPWAALPYLITRLEKGGEGMVDEERTWFARLRGDYRQLFPADPGQSEVFLFRVSRADPPTARSLRRPVEEVLRFVR
jgi:nitroreductase